MLTKKANTIFNTFNEMSTMHGGARGHILGSSGVLGSKPVLRRISVNDAIAQRPMLASVTGGKRYKVDNFVKDVNKLGTLIPKSTRDAATERANRAIAGSGRKKLVKGSAEAKKFMAHLRSLRRGK